MTDRTFWVLVPKSNKLLKHHVVPFTKIWVETEKNIHKRGNKVLVTKKKFLIFSKRTRNKFMTR